MMLVECFGDKGVLLEKDETLVIKEQLRKLIREGKRMTPKRRRDTI